MSQILELKIKGLYLTGNQFSEVPAGALNQASNLNINKPSIAETRRGMNFYGSQLGGPITKLFNYSNNLLVSYGTDSLAYDSDGNGTWVTYSGSYTPPTGDKIDSVEANNNFYFTSSEGIRKIDDVTLTPLFAGAPPALDGYGTPTGSTGFLNASAVVAYRIVWGYTDASSNLILGAPSSRIVVANTSMSDPCDVILTSLIPDQITTTWFFQVYRSDQTDTLAEVPDDEMQLVYERSPTSGEIAAHSFTFTDDTPDDLKGQFLYTSPSQEGLVNANYPPPYCLTLATYKGFTFGGNTTQTQALDFSILGVDAPSIGFVAATGGHTTSGSPTITNLSSTTNINVGMRAVAAGILANTTVLSVDSSTQVTLSTNATATATGIAFEFQDRLSFGSQNFWAGSTENVATNTFEVDTGGTPAENLTNTAISLVFVINSSAANTTLYAYYTSSETDIPGKIRVTARLVNMAAFAGTSTNGDSFQPVFPVSGTTVLSKNSAALNGLSFSKQNQPEAWPLLNNFLVGRADSPIQRIIPTRDILVILKTDGVFTLTGETSSNFRLSLLDNTVSIVGTQTAVPFNNQVFCFSNQGIIAIADTGVQVISQPIESQILLLNSGNYPNFATASFSATYEAERSFLFWTVSAPEDTYATRCWRYNSYTNAWTTWELDAVTALIARSDGRLYRGNPVNDYVYQERKLLDASDFADESWPVTITAANNLVVTLNDVSQAVVGYSLGQGSINAVITAVDVDNSQVTVSFLVPWSAGAAQIYKPIPTSIEWSPIDAQNPGMLKQFQEFTLIFSDMAFDALALSMSSNFSQAFQNSVLIPPVPSEAWGNFPWGDAPWGGLPGGPGVIRTYVQRQYQRAMWLYLFIESSQAFTSFSINGISVQFNLVSSKLR